MDTVLSEQSLKRKIETYRKDKEEQRILSSWHSAFWNPSLHNTNKALVFLPLGGHSRLSYKTQLHTASEQIVFYICLAYVVQFTT